jgi:hypothetical protein
VLSQQPTPTRDPLPKRIVKGIFAVIAAILLFLEDWVWDGMLAVMRWLGRLSPVRWVEGLLARLPPYAALLAFLIPAAVLLPFKLAAFWLIAQGHKLLGVQVFVIAKLVGTAFLARIFSLTKPALMRIGWFARAYEAFSGWKAQVRAYVKSLSTYQLIVSMKNAIHARWRAWRARP